MILPAIGNCHCTATKKVSSEKGLTLVMLTQHGCTQHLNNRTASLWHNLTNVNKELSSFKW